MMMMMPTMSQYGMFWPRHLSPGRSCVLGHGPLLLAVVQEDVQVQMVLGGQEGARLLPQRLGHQVVHGRLVLSCAVPHHVPADIRATSAAVFEGHKFAGRTLLDEKTEMAQASWFTVFLSQLTLG